MSLIHNCDCVVTVFITQCTFHCCGLYQFSTILYSSITSSQSTRAESVWLEPIQSNIPFIVSFISNTLVLKLSHHVQFVSSNQHLPSANHIWFNDNTDD